MMKRTLQISAILPFCVALYGCGGGHSHGHDASSAETQTESSSTTTSAGTQTDKLDTSTSETQTNTTQTVDEGTMTSQAMPPDLEIVGAQNIANGIWVGTKGYGIPAVALVSNDFPIKDGPAQFSFISGADAKRPGSLRYGTLRTNNGALAADLYDGAGQASYLRGKVDASNTLAGDVYNAESKVIDRYQFSFGADNAVPPNIEQLYGRYAAASNAEQSNVEIAAWPSRDWAPLTVASVKGKLPGCEFSGSIRKSPSGNNVYALDLLGEGPACAVPGKEKQKSHMTGLAALVAMPGTQAKSLVFAASYDKVLQTKLGIGRQPLVSVSSVMLQQKAEKPAASQP